MDDILENARLSGDERNNDSDGIVQDDQNNEQTVTRRHEELQYQLSQHVNHFSQHVDWARARDERNERTLETILKTLSELKDSKGTMYLRETLVTS